jgi:hypothetical protein
VKKKHLTKFVSKSDVFRTWNSFIRKTAISFAERNKIIVVGLGMYGVV